MDGNTAEWTESTSPVTAIAEAVAEVTDSDPTSLEPLEAQIRTDALNDLLQQDGASANGDGTGSVVQASFTYEGCWVVVENTGRVEVSAILDES